MLRQIASHPQSNYKTLSFWLFNSYYYFKSYFGFRRLRFSDIETHPGQRRRPVLLCRGKLPRARGMAAYVRDEYRVFRQPKFECGCCEMLVVRVCGLRPNFYVYSLYSNPDLDDRI